MAFLNKPSTTKVKKEESTPPKETVTSETVVKTSHEKPVQELKKDGGVKSKRKAANIDISDSGSGKLYIVSKLTHSKVSPLVDVHKCTLKLI